MSRALANLGLVVLCLGSVHGGTRLKATSQQSTSVVWAAVHQQKEPASPLAAQQTNASEIAHFTEQQRIAEQQTESAELDLKRNIATLQQLRSQHPNSAELDRTISALQALLDNLLQAAAQIQQAQAPASAKVAAAAEQANQWRQLSEQAQASANQGNQMAAATIAKFRPSPASPASRPSPASAAAPPRPTPSEPLRADRSPASVPAEQPSPPPPPPPAPIPSASPEEEWFNKLKNGLLQYSVPSTMLWKVPSTVTVQILGENAPAPGPIDNQNGQAPIKVARYMKVLVSAPDNPDEFSIAPESDTQLAQYVPENGPTTWHFSVTPRYTAKAQKLVVQAWVIFDANTQRELPVYKAVVNVHVPSLTECVKLLFEGDPDYWLKYGLPGGAGFVFLSGIVTGVWQWAKKKKQQKTPQPAGD